MRVINIVLEIQCWCTSYQYTAENYYKSDFTFYNWVKWRKVIFLHKSLQQEAPDELKNTGLAHRREKYRVSVSFGLKIPGSVDF